MAQNADTAIAHITALGDKKIAEHSAGFFQAFPGGYGDGDKFLGIRVPVIRQQVKKFSQLSLQDTTALLKNSYHEIRLFALLVWVRQFERGNHSAQSQIYRLYLAHTDYINNWDLVDSSCHKIVGPWLADKDHTPLLQLASSESLWERRIAMISCAHFINQQQFKTPLVIADKLLTDEHDLIHKAVGWMLREIGKRDMAVEQRFLNLHYQAMPRTMLRYAIEKFPPDLRRQYLQGTI